MRKAILAAIGAAMLAAAMSAPAQAMRPSAKRTERVVEMRYAAANNAGANGISTGVCAIDIFDQSEDLCLSVPLELRERYVKVEFQDASGQKVDASLMHGIGDSYTPFGEFCGAHKKPVRIPGVGGYVQIFYSAGTCPDGTPSLPTTGVIVFTFSNKP